MTDHIHRRRHLLLSCISAAALALVCATPFPAGAAQEPAAAAASAATTLTDAEIERFLRDAKIVGRPKRTAKGITGSLRVTLTDGTLTHDAQIQTIDESKREFQSAKGVEFNFRDSWTFNVAAYKIDRLLGLNMVPVSIARRHQQRPAAFTWWIDDVMMDEGERLKARTAPPDQKRWNEQMALLRLFDQLIYNIDRNLGNMLIGKDWRVWAIDHTRAFRTHDTLRSPESVTRCESAVLERLKALDRPTLKREVGRMLDDWQINSLLKRRDLIVARLESLGPAALFQR